MVVIDAGLGNVGSILNMIRHIGYDIKPAKTPDELSNAKKIILPGVGSFDSGVHRLRALGFTSALEDILHGGCSYQLLGICLGMQLLFECSAEGRESGLGIIPGEVKKFSFPDEIKRKIPHMGWNHVQRTSNHLLFEGMDHKARFYFAHSYHAVCSQEYVIATTYYGYQLPCAVCKENTLGVQFHPEKSHKYGMQLLKNFAEM